MGCAPGWSLRLLRVNGGGHALPRHDPDPGAPAWMRPVSRDFETAEEVWGFFAGVPARR
jgi:poly(3-hydroxybutyrate) depolymerase